MSTPATDGLMREISQRRRRARTRGAAAGIGSWLAAWLIIAMEDQAGGGSLLKGLATSVVVGAPVIGYATYARAVRPAGMLVWLRRFRDTYGDRMRFHLPLGNAALGIVQPVTIQDSSFRSSFLTAFVRGWHLWTLALFAWMVGLLLSATVVAVVTSAAAPPAAFVVVAILYTGAFVWGLSRLVVARGYREVRDLGWAKRRLDAIHGGRAGVPAGVEILQCSDAIWQDVVAHALSRARVAVIDLSDPTPNLQWELNCALERLDPRAIILTVEDGTALDRTWRDVVAPVLRGSEHALGRSWFEGAVVTYPRQSAGVGIGRARQLGGVSARLRTAIVAAVAAGRAGDAAKRDAPALAAR